MTVAKALVAFGGLLVALGVALWSVPGGVVTLGVALVAYGLWVVEVPEGGER